jgi:hypothetical protein
MWNQRTITLGDVLSLDIGPGSEWYVAEADYWSPRFSGTPDLQLFYIDKLYSILHRVTLRHGKRNSCDSFNFVPAFQVTSYYRPVRYCNM